MRLIGGNKLPSDATQRELYCLAANNPDTFYLRYMTTEDLVSGPGLELNGSWEADEQCGGDGDPSGGAQKSWTGYVCPSVPSAINFSASGSGRNGGFNLGGTQTYAHYIGDQFNGSQEVAPGDPDDCCDTGTDFGNDFTTSIHNSCCPVALQIEIYPGMPCGSDGMPDINVTVSVTLVPES